MIARVLIVISLVLYIIAALLLFGGLSGGPPPLALIALGLACDEGAKLA